MPSSHNHSINGMYGVMWHRIFFHVPFEKLVVFEIFFQGFAVINEFQGCHQLRKLFDERVGDVVVGFIQLFGQIIFVNFFHGFVGCFFDVLRRVFDLSLGDKSQDLLPVVTCFPFNFFDVKIRAPIKIYGTTSGFVFESP